MPNIFNADDGAISGSAGIKLSSDTSGVLNIQTNGTTAISISASQVVSFPATSGFSFAGQVTFAAGTAAAPSISVTGDTNTGIFFPGADQVAVSAGGVQRLLVDSVGTTLSTGVLTVPAGTVSAPSITTTGDSNTGIFFPAADTIAFAEGGVEAMRLDSAGNVGIGTSSPQDKLSVLTAQGLNTAANPVMTYGASTNWPAGFANIYDASYVDQFMLLNARMTGGTRATPTFTASSPANGGIALKVDGLSGGLAIQTIPNGTGQSATTRLYLNPSGNVGIGITNPTYKLEIQDTAPRVTLRGTNNGSNVGYRLETKDSGGTQRNGGYYYQPQTGTNESYLGLSVDDSGYQLGVKANGNVFLLGGVTNASGTGITFPATQNASSNANTLDDYEEGTWSPRIENAAGSTVVTLTNQGIYTKVGQMVHVQINAYSVSVSAFGATEHLYLAGLPFTSANSIYVLTFNTYVNQPVWAIDGGANTKFQLWVPASAVDYAIFTRNTWGGSATMTFRGNFVYEAS